MNENETIRIYTLGQLRLERYNGSEWLTITDPAWQQQRVRVLLRCLVSVPTRSMSRTLLLDQMWTGLASEAEETTGQEEGMLL